MANPFKAPSWARSELEYMEHAMAQALGPNATITSPPASYTTTDALKGAINSRMRGALRCDFWYPVYVEKRNVVTLFIIQNGAPAILEDEFDLFPSDALITKLRLML